jgi:hypothetical protein
MVFAIYGRYLCIHMKCKNYPKYHYLLCEYVFSYDNKIFFMMQVIPYDDPIVYVMVADACGHARTLLVILGQLQLWGLLEENNSDKFFPG